MQQATAKHLLRIGSATVKAVRGFFSAFARRLHPARCYSGVTTLSSLRWLVVFNGAAYAIKFTT